MYGLSGRELRFALVISSAHFNQHVYRRILPPLIPVLAVALVYPLWQLGLLISLYSLGSGLAQAPLGVIADKIDRRYLLPTGFTLAGAAYVAFTVAPVLGEPLPTLTVLNQTFEGGFLVMSLAMVVVGVGLAVTHPTGYPLITANVSESNKGKVLGAFGASSKFGDAATPAAIAALLLVLAWQQIILLFGVASILYGGALYVVLRDDAYETAPVERQADETAESADETEQQTDETTEAADETTEAADGDGTRRTYLYPITVVYLFFVSSGLATKGLNSFLPAFVVAIYAYSFEPVGVQIGVESVANVYFAGLLVAGGVTQLGLGGLTDTYDSRLILLSCMVVATAGLVVLALVTLHPLVLFVVVVVLGAGLYGVNPARDALISDLSPQGHEGRTFGYMFTAVSLTSTPLPTVIGYVLEVVGMREGFLVLAAGPVLAGICITLLYSSRIYVTDANTSKPVETSD